MDKKSCAAMKCIMCTLHVRTKLHVRSVHIARAQFPLPNKLAGDVGGVLGLFLGASMFTIIEFTQFIVCAVLRSCCGLTDKSSAHSPLTSNENL